jgi:hypothetical protein
VAHPLEAFLSLRSEHGRDGYPMSVQDFVAAVAERRVVTSLPAAVD